jgi:hypothetical protein
MTKAEKENQDQAEKWEIRRLKENSVSMALQIFSTTIPYPSDSAEVLLNAQKILDFILSE